MNRPTLFLMAALAFAGCDDKPAEAPIEAPAEASATEEPEAPAESAATGDKPEGAVEGAAMPANLEPGEQGFYGAKFTVIEEPIALAAAIEKAAKQPADKPETMKVAATISTVCKKKGCWFTMTGEGVENDVRVRMKDYAFFVPKNADAAKAVVEGTLIQREVPQDEAQHYADDAAKEGETPEKIDGPQQAWEFTATAIELQAAES